jgi:hypothetical protein
VSTLIDSVGGDWQLPPAVRLCALSLALGAGLSCERRAPGPDECQAFARQALGIPAQVQQLPPRYQSAVNELTVRCITTPFDRELLGCVDAGRSAQRCLLEYERRREASD